jgi:glycosyltransferase 2 family protein
MMKNLSTVLQYLFFLGLGFGLIWYSSKDLSDAQITELTQSFSQTRYLYILPVIGSLLLSHFHRALRWRLLMNPLGYAPGRGNTFLVVLIGYFFNLLVPRLGEVMKCTMLAKYEKIPADKLVGTIVAERAVDLICLVLVTLIMLLTQFDVLGESAIEGLKKAAEGAQPLKIILVIAGIAGGLVLIRFIVHRFAHIHLFAAIRKIGTGIWHGLSSIGKIREKGWFLFHTFMIWLLYLVSIYLGFKAFPAVADLNFNASVAILVFGSLGMILTQGGIGAYQLAVQKTLLLYGVTAVTGLAFGWVLWGAQTAIVLVAGIVSLLILPFVNKKNTTHA